MRYLIVFLFLLFPVGSAMAEPAPLNIRGTYHVSWNGIGFTKFWAAIEQPDATHFKLTATLKSKGLVRMFKKVKTYTTSDGVLTPHGWQTLHYRTEATYSDKTTLTALEYNSYGELTHREIVKEDDPKHRPPVDPEKVVRSQSLGSALWELRRLFSGMQADGTRQKSVHLYDGKRLMRVTITRGDDGVLGDIPVHVVTLSRELIDGITNKEIRKMKEEGEPPVYLYLTADDQLMPVGMEVLLSLGTISARFVAEP